MTENGSRLNPLRSTIRPAILADKTIVRFYGSFVRRVLVGLTGSACTAMLVGPESPDTHNILHPSVDYIVHPEIQFWPLAYKNRSLLLDKLLRLKPTLLHSFWPGDWRLTKWLSEAMELPTAVTVFEAMSIKSACQFPLSTVFAATSEPVYQSLLSSGIGPKQIVKVPIGTFVGHETVCFDQDGQLPTLVTCENMKNVADYEPLLLACRHLLADGFDFSLALMGEGAAERPIRHCIKRLGLTSAVTVVPPLRPVRPVLQGVDVFIHLKDRGRCNLAMLEAMSVGLVVVGCPDSTIGLLRDKQTAIICDTDDEASIYQGLKQVLSEPSIARRLAENARLYLQENHSVSGMLDGCMELYQLALNSTPRRT